jgi:hypothetical protein
MRLLSLSLPNNDNQEGANTARAFQKRENSRALAALWCCGSSFVWGQKLIFRLFRHKTIVRGVFVVVVVLT